MFVLTRGREFVTELALVLFYILPYSSRATNRLVLVRWSRTPLASPPSSSCISYAVRNDMPEYY